MNEKLAHLSNQQIDELINRYYTNEGDTASKLIQEYSIDVSPSRLYTLFPNIVCEEVCEYCNIHLEMPAKSKTAQKSKYTKEEKICPQCGHIPDDRLCLCSECSKKRQQTKLQEEKNEQIKQAIQRKQIEETYRFNANNRVDISQLDFIDRVYLGAIMRGFLSEDLSFINPINPLILAPTVEFASEIIKRLTRNRILVVDSSSDIKAFVQDDNFPNTYYIYKVKYNINLILPENKNELFKELMYPKELDKDNTEIAYMIWKKIAVDECIEYLKYQLKQVKFDFSAGEKTYAVFNELLEYFSVSQIYGIIWKKVSDATRLYQGGNMTKKHAANTVIGGCQSYGERARLNKWDLNKYSRLKDLPQTTISEFFFNQILHIGDMGFNMSPTVL